MKMKKIGPDGGPEFYHVDPPLHRTQTSRLHVDPESLR